MRVAIVGGGIGGCSCAWQLAQLAREQVKITVFEMGRGAGGRTATRRSRDLPGLALNHGAPLFHVRQANALASPLVAVLMAAKHITKWQGSYGQISSATGALEVGTASRGEPLEQDAFERFIGSHGMSSVADGLLKLAGEVVETRYGTKVSSLKPLSGGATPCWALFDKEGNHLGEFDWVVITSASMAHSRWLQTFGEEPPLRVAAELQGSAKLIAAVSRIDGLRFDGVHVAMLAWALPGDEGDGRIAEVLRKLPFDVTEVSGDAVLAKVVRQSVEAPYASVVLHSTAAFAEQHAQVFGSTGTAARMGAPATGSDLEAVVVGELQAAFSRLLADRLGEKDLPAPTFGPVLHRWGSAFVDGDAAPVDGLAGWAIEEARVVFAGDFVAPPYACVESTMASGVAAANAIFKAEGLASLPRSDL